MPYITASQRYPPANISLNTNITNVSLVHKLGLAQGPNTLRMNRGRSDAEGHSDPRRQSASYQHCSPRYDDRYDYTSSRRSGWEHRPVEPDYQRYDYGEHREHGRYDRAAHDVYTAAERWWPQEQHRDYDSYARHQERYRDSYNYARQNQDYPVDGTRYGSRATEYAEDRRYYAQRYEPREPPPTQHSLEWQEPGNRASVHPAASTSGWNQDVFYGNQEHQYAYPSPYASPQSQQNEVLRVVTIKPLLTPRWQPDREVQQPQVPSAADNATVPPPPLDIVPPPPPEYDAPSSSVRTSIVDAYLRPRPPPAKLSKKQKKRLLQQHNEIVGAPLNALAGNHSLNAAEIQKVSAHVTKRANAQPIANRVHKPQPSSNLALRPSSKSPGSPSKHIHPRPTPTTQYLHQSSQPPLTIPYPTPLLIVLDLNGTLLHRKRHGTTIFEKRPFILPFLTYLLQHHHILIWSSAQPQNVQGMVDKLLSKDEQTKLVGVWSRNQLKLPQNLYWEKVQVYKRLTTVWADEGVQGRFPGGTGRWGQANTVLIDDNAEKAASEPYNLVEIEEFVGREEQKESDVLGQVVVYLETLRRQIDVSSYIRATPFRYEEGRELDWVTLKLKQKEK